MATKRSLFSKPKWAAVSGSVISDDQPIFKQKVYEDILKASNLKEEKRRLKKQQQVEARPGRTVNVDAQTHSARTTKRRRLSPNFDASYDSVPFPKNKGNYNKSQSDSELDENISSPHSSCSAQSPASPPATLVRRESDDEKKDRRNVALESRARKDPGDIDDEVVMMETIRTQDPNLSDGDTQTEAVMKAAPAPSTVDSDSEDDDYLRELRRKARAEAVQKKARMAIAAAAPSIISHASPSLPVASSRSGIGQIEGKLAAQDDTSKVPPTACTADTEVQILIRSIIPSTSEVVVKRLASQPLDKVHLYWCERNQIPLAMREKIFFIWRMQRLFNTTTMRGILRQIARTHGTKSDGTDLSEGKIVIEAVTSEIFEHRLQQRERDRQEKAGTGAPTAEGKTVMAEAALSSAAEQRAGIVISLVAPNMPAFKLRVRPDTAITKIIRGYRSKHSVESNKDIYLIFDGEKLEDDIHVGETELEDGDSVDVRIM